jgi:hypothetical protein
MPLGTHDAIASCAAVATPGGAPPPQSGRWIAIEACTGA